jgi:ATP-dependent Clp protease, protease subunit
MVLNFEELVKQAMARKDELDKWGVYFLGTITDDEAERCCKALLIMGEQRRDYPGSEITIYINSGGGSVGAGLAIMEMMSRIRRECGVKINTIVLGYAYSMGAIILQAGDKRSMGPLSTLMVHSGQWVLSGNDQQLFEDYHKLADHLREKLSEVFASRSGKHDTAWWADFIYSGRDHFLTAKESLELGLIDEVTGWTEPALQ